MFIKPRFFIKARQLGMATLVRRRWLAIKLQQKIALADCIVRRSYAETYKK